MGKVASRKADGSFWVESELERDAARLFELDTAVRRILSQPFRLTYWDGGVRRTYVPDFWLGGQADRVIEVKPAKKAADPEFQRFERVVRNAFAAFGMEYVVLTEDEIRRQPRLDNAKRLLRYRDVELPPDLVIAARRWARDTTRPTFGTLRDALSGGPQGLCHAYALLAQHHLTYDIHLPLDGRLALGVHNIFGGSE